MRICRAMGKTVTAVGGGLFLLFAATLGFSLYGKVQSNTLSAALMVCATASAFAFSIGRYLQSEKAKSSRQDMAVKKDVVHS